MNSVVYDLYRSIVLQKLHNSVTNQVDTACFFSPALLLLELLPATLFALNIMKILHRSNEFNHHRQIDRQRDENDRHMNSSCSFSEARL